MTIGYGDPVEGGLGYGDPSPIDPVLDLGYGDPSFLLSSLFSLSEGNIVYHTGGAEVIISGSIVDEQAPYQLYIEVDGTRKYFYGGSAGEGFNIYPNNNVLICYAPPAPVGSYTVFIKYGIAFSQNSSLNITYATDNKGYERYNLRSYFPSHYKTDARFSNLDSLDEGIILQDETNLGLITDTIGRVFQEISGSALTRTRSFTARGSTHIELESILGLENQGEVWIRGELLSYSLDKPNKKLILADKVRSNIKEKEEVFYHAP